MEEQEELVKMDNEKEEILDLMSQCILKLIEMKDIYNLKDGYYVATKNDGRVLILQLMSRSEEDFEKHGTQIFYGTEVEGPCG